MLADHVGREQTITALGRTWRVGRWTRAVWDEWLQWLRTRIPDPLQVLKDKLDQFPQHLQGELVRQAIDRANEYLAPGSPLVTQALGSLEGNAHLFYLLLQEHQPTVTPDDALQVAMEIGEQRGRVLRDVSGVAPEGNG